jgi:Domain of unknown function (DUF3597)
LKGLETWKSGEKETEHIQIIKIRFLSQRRTFCNMGMLTNLISKIFGHASAAPPATGAPANTVIESATAPSATTSASSAVSPATPAPAATTAAAAPAPTVDVSAILDSLAAKNPEKLDWKTSIVDLMKLVDMDSSLSARKKLATELHYSGDENDSATMNVWLHKQVLKELAEHGGKIPPELL